MTSPLMMQQPVAMMGGQQQRPGSAPGHEMQPAMAFTYVPVPVYNMGGLSLPGMGMAQSQIPSSLPVGIPNSGQNMPTSRTKTPTRSTSRGDLEIGAGDVSPNKPQGTSTPSGAGAVGEPGGPDAAQQQRSQSISDPTMAYQQAFLQVLLMLPIIIS